MRKFRNLSFNYQRLLTLWVAAMIFALILPEFSCITALSTKTLASIASAGHLSKSPLIPDGHASCIAHVAVTNKPARITGSSTLVDLLNAQAKVIKWHYFSALNNNQISQLLKPDKFLPHVSYEEPLSLALVSIRSTVLLI
jgi:hypothetical protein